MKKRIHLLVKLAFGLSVGVFVLSCQQNEGILPDDPLSEFQREGSPMILGKQLENPYSVENMKKALENLTARGRIDEGITIETTDLYVRFLPVDSLEQQALESDSTLELFDFPLDFEIEEVGHWYHDPSIPDHLPTYQYTVVKPDQVLPDTIEHEILADLFLVEDLMEEASSSRSDGRLDFLRALEDEALHLTDNWEPRIDLSNARWNPKGTVKVQEAIGDFVWNSSTGRHDYEVTKGGHIPVKGIRVRARRWFTIKTDYTDQNGYYKISSFVNRPVNYSLVFRTPRFRVSGWTGYANRYNGPKKESSWNPKFNWHSEWWVRSTVMNAMYEFRKQADNSGVKFPSTVLPARVRVVLNEGRSSAWRGWIRHYIPFTGAIVRNDVKLYSKTQYGNLATNHLFATTMHELAHVSHFKKSPINSALSLGMVNESFAVAVEYEFTKNYYLDAVSHIKDASRTNIEFGGGDGWKYTPYFIDLIDNTNQFVTRGNSTNTDYANDRVSGYTLIQFQTALDKRTSLHGVKQYLRDNFSNQSGFK